MSPSHVSTFRVRQYECDAYGHLNNVNYVRYLGEASLEALTAAGYDPARHATLDRRWQTRRLDIEYLRPARYGDAVEVQVSMRAFDAAILHRSYAFHLVGSGDLVAQAQSEAVFLDATTGQQADLPQELADAFGAGEPADPTPTLQELPPLPEPPPGVFTMPQRVAWQDLDMTGQVAGATLLGYVEACGFGVVAAHGWPAARMAAEGFAIILRQHQMQHFASAALDDELEIATWASGVKRATAMRHYTIRRARDGALLARVDTLGVWVELATGRPIRIPPGFMADFAPNLVS
jgi:acyl-CoA thioester hydrolase